MSEVVPEYFEFAGKYIDVMRGWNSLVDIDVAPERPEPTREYNTLAEVRTDIENLAALLPADEQDREVLEQKLAADVLYLRALGGETIEFHEYVAGTTGISPEPIDEERVQGGLAVLDMLLKERKLGYDASFKEAFEQKFVTKNPGTVEKDFRGSLRKVRKAAKNLVVDPGDSLDIKYIDDPKAFWTAYLGRAADRFLMRVNLAKPLSKDWINTATAHEYGGHVLQLQSWQRAIQSGDMNAALGVTAVHTAYAVQAEGLAQTAEHLLLDDSWGSVFQALYNECAGRVSHNARYMIATGEDPRAAERYARERLPFLPAEFVSADALKAQVDHPLYRTYLMAYAPSIELLRPVRSMESDRQKRVLETLYNRAMTPAQISRLVLEDQKIAA